MIIRSPFLVKSACGRSKYLEFFINLPYFRERFFAFSREKLNINHHNNMKNNNNTANSATAADATPDTLNIQNATLNITSAGSTLLIAQTLVDAQPSTHCVDEVLAFNTELVVEHDSTVVVYLQVDDEGDLLITRNPLVAADESARNAAMQAEIDAPAADTLHFHKHLQGDEWKHIDNALLWLPEMRADKLRLFTFSAGTYYISARLSNDNMAYVNENRKLFRYAIHSLSADSPMLYEADATICPSCGCGGDFDGDADSQPASDIPSTNDDICRAQVFPVLTAEGKTALKYDGPWGWTCSRNATAITITPTKGMPLTFAVDETDASLARPQGDTSKRDFRMQLQNADGTPCTTGEPARLMLTDSTGLSLVFDADGGNVIATKSPEGKMHEKSVRDTQITEVIENGLLKSVVSATEGSLLATEQADGGVLLEWFAPAADAAYKSATYRMTSENGVQSTAVTRQQRDRDAHGSTRVQNGNTVTITKGEGEEAIVRTFTTSYPTNGIMQRIESVQRVADELPASCSCTTMQYTEGGWLLIERKEGFGSELEQTEQFFYNEQFRLSRSFRHNGHYTLYSYDTEGRVTEVTSPKADGMKSITRTTYANGRFFDNRPATVTEFNVNANGTEVLFRTTTHVYEDTAEVERVTSTVTAGGSSQQQVSIEETYANPANAYAAGKPKFSQGIDGVQTWHEYAATTEHGAVQVHTSITKVNGELVAAQSRKSESFFTANDTVIFEQESIWNGAQWLLLDTTAYEYDEQQRITKTTRGNGRFSTTTWMCCGRLSETDEDGITTTYAYDSARQLTEVSRNAVYDGDTCITPETITEYIRDAEGRILSTTRRVGAMETTESTEFDALGRVTKQTDVLGRMTTTSYSADGLITTVTTPAGATAITTRNTDGSTASIGGTAQRALVYVYDINGNSERHTTKLTNGTTIAQSITNGFGQTTVQAQASTTGFIYTRSEFNAKGQLTKQYQDTGWNTEKTAATLYEYDSFGNVTKQTLALATTPTKDNSPVVEMAYSVESAEDGVYSVTTQTRYNAEGTALTSSQKQLISQLSESLEQKTITVNERGLTSINYTLYTAPTVRTTYSTIPTSTITACAVVADGFALSQTDYAGITSTATRNYTANGMVLVNTDGRNNATTSITDLAGRTVSVTDAANNTTTTVYDSVHDLPAVVTDAQGNTACYKYDHRGRKIAEWGTALQPACFGYDELNNMTKLMTFRDEPATNEDGSPCQSAEGAAAGDPTTWMFDAATGLELSKTYADNTSVVKTYDAYNRLATETNARGYMKAHTYEHARGLLLNITYYYSLQEGETEPVVNNFTSPCSFAYNHLGQLVQVIDAAGTRTLGYNNFGEQETDSLLADGVTHLITELRDEFGRSVGYTYAKNGAVQQTVSTGYGTDGRISTAGFMHGGEMKQFGYTYLAGSNLLQVLNKPSGMSLTHTYETTRDLLTGIAYHRGSTLVAQRTYSYDTLGRPTARNTARQGSVVNDTFTHNTRSELVTAQVNGTNYEYAYDNIGNRTSATEGDEVTGYASNELNQYTMIRRSAEDFFVPEFDADGNQYHIQTETGDWALNYNAANRPTDFSCMDEEGNFLTVKCDYDFMGRRVFKKVISGTGTVTSHQRFIYRGYLQIACVDLTRTNHPALWLITWDPSEPVATRPLAIQKDGTRYTYGLDLTKNVCEVFGATGNIRTAYTYSPYGSVTAIGNVTQPIQWSSEFNDSELGLVYWESLKTLVPSQIGSCGGAPASVSEPNF